VLTEGTETRAPPVLNLLIIASTSPRCADPQCTQVLLIAEGDLFKFVRRSHATPRNKFVWNWSKLVVAVDVRSKTLRGAANLDAQKNFIFTPAYCTSEICIYLSKSTGGAREDLQTC
jgi:hypothetical protein